LEDGSLINEIPNADFYPTPKEDGTTHWQFGLPPGEYEVIITGTGEGEYHLMVGDGLGNIVKYEVQGIAGGEQVTAPIDQESLEQPMTTAAGQVLLPTLLTEDNLNQLDFGSPMEGITVGAGANGDQGANNSPTASDDSGEVEGQTEGEVPSTSSGLITGGGETENSFGPLDPSSRVQRLAAAVGIFASLLCFMGAVIAGGFLIYRLASGR